MVCYSTGMRSTLGFLAVAMLAGCAADDGETSELASEAVTNRAAATSVIAVDQASARVLRFDVGAADWSNDAAVLWSWSPSDSREIESGHRSWFSNLSDVK